MKKAYGGPLLQNRKHLLCSFQEKWIFHEYLQKNARTIAKTKLLEYNFWYDSFIHVHAINCKRYILQLNWEGDLLCREFESVFVVVSHWARDIQLVLEIKRILFQSVVLTLKYSKTKSRKGTQCWGWMMRWA